MTAVGILLAALTVPLGCGDPAATARAPAQKAPAGVRPSPLAERGIDLAARGAGTRRLPREAEPPDAMSTLTLIAEEPDSLTRRLVLETLARDPGALDAIAAAMVDPDESIRERAQQLFDEALESR